MCRAETRLRSGPSAHRGPIATLVQKFPTCLIRNKARAVFRLKVPIRPLKDGRRSVRFCNGDRRMRNAINGRRIARPHSFGS